MIKQTKRYSRAICLAISLTASFGLILAESSVARASGENDAGGDTPVTAAATRTSPVRPGRQRVTEERTRATAIAGKRDPFKLPLPPQMKGGGDELGGPLPPGVRGLVIGSLRLKGIVCEEDSKAMIAVVANRANLAYFLHVDEGVYNGVVSRITPDAIYFQEKRPDSAGRLEAKEIVLRLGSERQEAR